MADLMMLRLIRDTFTERTTSGVLQVDGEPECVTLEDRIRAPGVKVPGATAIDALVYEVNRTYSQRFGRIMPILLAVPRFEGVRIHAGNGPDDTEGCILVGSARGPDYVSLSRDAFRKLEAKIFAALKVGRVQISIENHNPPEGLLR
jgi:hypothetical protein